jgi:hypothetical protein
MSMAVLAALGASFFVALGIVLSTQINGHPLGAALGAVPIAMAIFIAVALALDVSNELLIQALVDCPGGRECPTEGKSHGRR